MERAHPKKGRKNVDFTASLGDDRKAKFKRISKAKNRTMAGQLKSWIDESPDPEKQETR